MAAALRGIEINADIILYAKNVDGVYDKDPRTNPDAKKYSKIRYSEIITRQLNVIDIAAAVLCDQFAMNSILFALETPENIVSVLEDKNIGTVIEK
jgi:uridylate kinase